MNKVIIISAPSGAGKSTLINHLIEQDLPLGFSISATNRKPRKGEIDGKHYYFFDTDTFRQRVDNKEFVEWEEVYKDRLYGTLKTEIERIKTMKKTPIFDLDVEGGLKIKKVFGDHALAIFVKPPSVKTLRRRLTDRQTDSAEDIDRRVEKATKELEREVDFDRIIVNDKLEKAKLEIEKLVREFIKENNTSLDYD
ncbi:MAG: guanylate kinase [Bacteroidales bacterium]